MNAYNYDLKLLLMFKDECIYILVRNLSNNELDTTHSLKVC